MVFYACMCTGATFRVKGHSVHAALWPMVMVMALEVMVNPQIMDTMMDMMDIMVDDGILVGDGIVALALAKGTI